jgi:hypothetical protein
MTVAIDTVGLSKEGFTLIRNLLGGRHHLEDETKIAFKIAEALHNLPEAGNNFLEEMTISNVEKLASEHRLCQSLQRYVGLDETR